MKIMQKHIYSFILLASKALVLTSILLFMSNSLFSKNTVEIKNIELKNNNNKLEISYEIKATNQNQGFFATIEVFNKKGHKYNASTYSNANGQTIVYNGKNIIIWDAEKDNEIINELINVNIILTKDISISLKAHIGKTIIYPGLGNYRLGNGKHYFTYGLASYGLIASGFVLNSYASQSYNNYKQSMDIDLSDKYFNKAHRYNSLSYLSFGLGTAVWIANVVGVINRHKKTSANISPETSSYYYALSQEKYTVRTKDIYFDNRPLWQKEKENGDHYYKAGNYADARKSYIESLRLNPSNELIASLLKETELRLEEIRLNEENYLIEINIADSLIKTNDYSKAKAHYEKSLTFKANEIYPKSQIDICNKKIEEERINNIYNSNLAEADALFINKRYNEALEKYNEAYKLKPKEEYAYNKIQEINTILINQEFAELIIKGKTAMQQGKYEQAKAHFNQAKSIKPNDNEANNLYNQAQNKINEIEKAKADKEYADLINNGDVAFNKKEYDVARVYYQQALRIKPNQQYPKTKIEQIEDMYKKPDNFAESLPELYKRNKKAVFFIIAEKHYNTSQGSGFFITDDGIAITNYHVLDGKNISSSIIYTYDNKEYKIEKILEKNEKSDYIIFRVKKNAASQKLNYLKVANNLPEIGERIFAIGNPEGLEQTLSDGIVSGYRDYKNIKYIQFTAAITKGSSGGPLFNSKGEVIGITTMGQQEGSLFFAISIKELPLWKYIK